MESVLGKLMSIKNQLLFCYLTKRYFLYLFNLFVFGFYLVST